jgi:hypothetical protein
VVELVRQALPPRLGVNGITRPKLNIKHLLLRPVQTELISLLMRSEADADHQCQKTKFDNRLSLVQAFEPQFLAMTSVIFS